MTPTPTPTSYPSPPEPRLFARSHPSTPEDEIVISGISGKFPKCSNVEEFSHNLYNKIDMVDDEEIRWRHFNVEIPRRMGKIRNLDKFDATFFGVHFKQAHTMDPQCRLLIETAYEAVLDAGVNPKTLRGSRTGVFMGACFSESEKTWFYEKISSGGFGITGCSRAMLANRISYSLGLTGPSFLLDTACSSSMYALDQAFTAMRNGECDAALVGGANLVMHPYVTLQFARLGVLAPDGYCRPFDVDATGYTRSEAICVLYLQKAKDAKRVYSTVVYSKTNCDGYKAEGITYPSGKIQQKLLTEFYEDIRIDPVTVSYVEAHSTGTIVGDPEECQAIDNIFCKGRENPLIVGSVKSNIGHSESTSGACSVVKSILAFEKGLIAPNINFTRIRPGIKSLEDGRLRVCTDVMKLEGSLIGVNSFGFGGANAHCLLKRNPKEKSNNGAPLDQLPRLINWSGRTEESINVLLDSISTKPLDIEYVSLIHSTQSEETAGYIFRGYGLFEHCPNGNAKCLVKEVSHFSGLKRPVIWIFSGMGSQWPEMGVSLMELPFFKDSILKSHDVLLPYGLDLLKIITSSDPKMFDNILHSFVGIAAIQVAIVDVLRALNMSPDYIIGHSVGELGCAYGDECLTAEQMVLCAYSRGLVSLNTKVVRGSMAAIGLSYKQIKNMLPQSIEVACHNGPDSSTISGPDTEVAAFVAELKSKGIFAKEVACSNIPYHSKYIADMGPKLLASLKKIIPNPMKRSAKWLSSSVPKNRWEIEGNQYSSAEYHTNNLLGSVLFEETSTLLPDNAITVEIAPHGLLQAILKKSMKNSVHVPLTQRGNKKNIDFMLSALGKLFMNGVSVPFERLYPPVQFPVSRGTDMIAPYVRWEHSEDWFITKFELQRSTRSGERKVKITLTDQDYDFIAGHTIDGRCLFPATAYLQLVWETLAMMKGPIFFDMNVEFEDIRFLRATSLAAGQVVEFTIMIHTGTGRFEITEGATAVVTGFIAEVSNPRPLTTLPELRKSDFPILKERDFYKELRLRGYHYNGAFRSVSEARGDGLYGKVKWDLNWIAFMDCLLQISILGKDSRSLILPTRIQKMRINAKDHMQLTASLTPENPCFEVHMCPTLGILISGGIEIFGMHTSPVARRKPPGYPVLESYQFIPHFPTKLMSKSDAIRVCVQLALENYPITKVKAVEVDTDNLVPLIPIFEIALGDLPLVTSDLMLLTTQDLSLGKIHVEDGKLSTQKNCAFVIANRCLSSPESVAGHILSLNENGYLISREPADLKIENVQIPANLQLISCLPTTDDESIVIFQRLKRRLPGAPATVFIQPDDQEYNWLEKLKSVIKESGTVLVVAEKDNLNGIVGLINCIRKEPNCNKVSCVFVHDHDAPPFDYENPFYNNQLRLGLAINVFKNGQWGTYRHKELVQYIDEIPRTGHCYGNVLQRGDLSTLSWIQGSINTAKEDKVVNIQYASINFRDVMLATGRLAVEVFGTNRLEQECILGFEYAGVNKQGERVMGTVISGAMATQVIPAEHLTWRVPDKWTLLEAATCPVVYLTVYTAYFLFNPISRGKSILIHAGSGGVGLAAIRVALAYGMIVYTTVSNAMKKKFLLDTYPELNENHIGNSRDCSFETMIKLQTDGQGVDYVLNSLSDDKLHASIRCLGRGGTFLEIGKFDLANDTKIGLGHFLKEISFRSVLVDNLFVATMDERKEIYQLVQNDLKSGIIQPIFSTVFDVNELEKAYRYLSTGKHVGKVVLKIRNDPFGSETVPIKMLPKVYCDSEEVFVIPGGLGGFGLELADWLIIRGARRIVLSSSRGLSKSYQEYRIKIWETYGTKVKICTSDITTRSGCQQLLQESQKLGRIGGIFNLAVCLQDSILENQSTDKFVKCMAPKAMATRYLDELSRKMCPQLKHFVVFSSVSCGRGNAGQSNYGMANSVMERIIEQRAAVGLPAKAIQWGAVGEVGLVADMAEDKLDMEIGGTLQQRISSCLAELDPLLMSNEPIVASMVVAEKRIGSGGKDNIIDSVLNIMGIRDIKSISMTASLSEVGMDSLMAVEIKQTLEREFEIFLTPSDLRSLTFAKLQEFSDARLKEGTDNVKLKLASDKKFDIFNQMLKNMGDESTSDRTLLRLKSKNIANEFNSCLMIIPGIEGIAGSLWHTLAENINLPAFLLQLTSTYNATTIMAIVNELADVAKQLFDKKEFFYLVGYSFGSFITLEIARILEEAGMTGNILLIDGAPVFLRQLSYGHITSNVTDESIQLMLIIAIVQNIFPEESPEEILAKLIECETWEKKVDKLVEFGKAQSEYSENYMRQTTEAMYNRLKMVFEYDTKKVDKIKSPITLVRPTEVAVVDIDEDYELSRFTDGQINLKFIEGNHTTVIENMKLAEIINDCDPYFESDKNFMAYIESGKNT